MSMACEPRRPETNVTLYASFAGHPRDAREVESSHAATWVVNIGGHEASQDAPMRGARRRQAGRKGLPLHSPGRPLPRGD